MLEMGLVFQSLETLGRSVLRTYEDIGAV